MANFDTSAIVAYAGGAVSSEKKAGYYGNQNLVIALPFKTGNSGANAFSFLISKMHNEFNPVDTATKKAVIAFAITPAGDETYENFNGDGDGVTYNGAGDGEVIFTTNSYGTNYYDISGTVDKMLLPNTDYILWIFPNYTEYRSLTTMESVTVPTYELSGAAGLVRIDTGDGFVNAIPYIDNGETWDQAIPYIDDGEKFNICG